MKQVTLLAIGFAAVLLLAACGSLVAGVVEPGSVEPVPVPTDPATAVREEPQVEPTATEEKPTVAPTATVTESETDVDDDRPDRLRAATAGWNTNWDLHSIDYDELLSGGPPRDGIPSIDEPNFISPAEAAGWLAGNEPVLLEATIGE